MSVGLTDLPVIDEAGDGWVGPGDWRDLLDVIQAQIESGSSGDPIGLEQAHSCGGYVQGCSCGHKLDPDVGASAPAYWWAPFAGGCPRCMPRSIRVGYEQIDVAAALELLRGCVETELAWRDYETEQLEGGRAA